MIDFSPILRYNKRKGKKNIMKLPDEVVLSAYKDFGLSSNNPWEGTPFEKYYQTGAKQKGALGEIIVVSFLENEGMTVDKPKKSRAR